MKIVAAFTLIALIVVGGTESLRGLPADPAPVVFTQSKLAVRKPDGKRDLVRTDIHIYDDRIEILKNGKREVLETISYDQIQGTQYSYSKSPRWKSGLGVALVAGVFALPFFFMKGKKHWFTIQQEGDYVVLKLDKRIYRELIAAFESKSGVDVERLKEED